MPPSPPARLRPAPEGYDREFPEDPRAPAACARSSLCRTTDGAQPSRLDDLPRDGKASQLAKPAQALDDRFILQLFGGAAILADYELAFVGMLDIAAGDERGGAFEFMDQLVSQQELAR